MKVNTAGKIKRTKKSTPRKIDSYDAFKKFGDKQYTGMRVGGGHKWY